METLKSKGMRLGTQTGSFFNYLMSHNSSVPEVGKGATVLLWTDRHAYEVIEVDEKKKMCVIQRYARKRVDNFGMSDSQDYEYKELTNEKITLFYKWGSWKYNTRPIVFTEEAQKKYSTGSEFFYPALLQRSREEWKTGVTMHEAYKAAGGQHDLNCRPCTIIPGLTKQGNSWNSINILFGTRREYYDFSF